MKDGLNIDEIDKRFLVHGRMEILDVLNELVYRCERVTVAFGTEAFSTHLLEVHDKTIVFDSSGDSDTDRRLLMCGTCSLITFPGGIRVQFTGNDVRRTVWDEKEAFQIPLPDRLLRLQRQETFRAVVPADRAIAVTLFSEDGAALGDWPLRDLSVGGLGISLKSDAELAVSRKVSSIRFALPNHGEIHCKVTLRHVTDLTRRESESGYRLGMSFSELGSAARAAVQRYVVDIEHARRSINDGSETNEDAGE
jgi:c-di-GMP-binding flagellar brake protein YcgR